MRVLLFSTAYLPHIGGAELAIREITSRLPEIEFDLITAKLKKGLKDFERIDNVNIYRIGAGNKFLDKPLLPNLGFLKALKLHRKKHYDLIHGLMASYGSAAAYLFKTLNKKIPFILTLQEGDLGRNSPFDRFWQRRIIKKADFITVISNYLFEFAKNYNKKAQVFVVPNGVDLNKFKVESEKLKVKGRNSKTIVTVSRLVPKNGIDILIKAFPILNTKYSIPNTNLLVIGDGPDRKKLERLSEKLGLKNKVKFLGELEPDKVPEYLSEADVFVRPSRSEGLGSAFLEAMAAEIPVIATPVGGIPDLIKDRKTGLFCEKENPEDLAEKINEILTDLNLSQTIISNAQKLVNEKYSWDVISKEMGKIYAKAIHNYSGI